jgi:hypothetical protein
MTQIRCTQSVQKMLGLGAGELAEIKQSSSLLGDWYVNLTTIDRRKCFIFMNEKTLLSFIIFGVKKNNTKHFIDVFQLGLVQTLALIDVPKEITIRIIEGIKPIEFTKTASRVLLGNLNDIVQRYQWDIMYDGGFGACNLNDIIYKVNTAPERNLGWDNAIKAVKKAVGLIAVNPHDGWNTESGALR